MTASAPALQLRETRCAICGTPGNADERWPARLDANAFTPEVFSARRLPDRQHYRMVICRSCGLLRSDPVLEEGVLAELYESSTFDYADELEGLRATYGGALGRLEALSSPPRSLLDIGCGNGFVLDVALGRGWEDARGVEPSADAIAKAPAGIGERIVQDVMRPGLFADGTFTAITLFQVLDHIPDPLQLLEACRAALAPGGLVLAWNHNAEALSAKVLGERSPIVDVEHTYLYSPGTMESLFARAGFSDIEVQPVRNTYSLSYLTHLLPLPRAVKERALPRLGRTRAGKRQLTVPLGNLCLVARAR